MSYVHGPCPSPSDCAESLTNTEVTHITFEGSTVVNCFFPNARLSILYLSISFQTLMTDIKADTLYDADIDLLIKCTEKAACMNT